MTSPVFEEAAKLLSALGGWAEEHGPAAAAAAASVAEAVGAHRGGFSGVGGAGQCTMCPVCQAIALVREASPEVYQHLSEAASALGAAFAALLDSAGATSRPGRPATRVQHIEVG